MNVNTESVLCQKYESIDIKSESEPDENYQNNQPILQEFVRSLSDNISKTMLPLYEKFQESIQKGKILSVYPFLKFPDISDLKVNNFDFHENQSSNLTDQEQSSNSESFTIYQRPNTHSNSNSISQQKLRQIRGYNENYVYNNDIKPKYQPGSFVKNNLGNVPMGQKKWEKTQKQLKKLQKQKRRSKKEQRRELQRRGFKRPKKAKSIYNLFVQDVVPQIKAQNPTFSAPDLVRVAAKMYNKMTQQERVPYRKRYLEDKERFDRERQEYFRKYPQMDYRNDKKKQNDRYQGLPNFSQNYIHL